MPGAPSHIRRAVGATLGLALLAACRAESPPSQPSSASLYVASGATDEVFRLDPQDGSVRDTFRLDPRRAEIDEPHGVAVAPDGRYWYATVSHGEPTLWKFERPTDRLVGRVTLSTFGAARIGITPDGAKGFIPDYYRSGQGAPSGMAVVALDDLSVLARPTVCPAPHDAQLDPSGETVAIACSLGDEVVLMDANSLSVTARFTVGDAPGPPGSPRYKPLNLVWSPRGARLYVGLFAAGAIGVFSATGEPVGRVAVGAGPAQLALVDDGAVLLVANRDDASLSIVDTGEMRESSRVRLDRAHPHGLAVDARGEVAFVTYEGDTTSRGGVVAVDLASASILWAVEVGAFTLGIAYAEPIRH